MTIDILNSFLKKNGAITYGDYAVECSRLKQEPYNYYEFADLLTKSLDMEKITIEELERLFREMQCAESAYDKHTFIPMPINGYMASFTAKTEGRYTPEQIEGWLITEKLLIARDKTKFAYEKARKEYVGQA